MGDGREEGRKGGRKEGRKGGRKEGRKQELQVPKSVEFYWRKTDYIYIHTVSINLRVKIT
ncbi:MAG TPA: hypothetical protein VE244_14955 [Nitrososphaeraceae archaeon]|nr:hypothetical protein [Nitrososphaeraceae archaeon]